MKFTAVSLLPSDPVDSIFEVAKISYQTLVMLTKVSTCMFLSCHVRVSE